MNVFSKILTQTAETTP